MGLPIYFLPTVIALGRGHHHRWAIFVVNLFSGWIGFGWVIALAWACAGVRHER